MSAVRRRVLVGFGEALAVAEAVWSLQAAGHEVVAFLRRGISHPARRLHGVRIVELAAPELDAAAAVDGLRALVRSGDFDVVLPLDDIAIWLIEASGVGDTVRVAGPTGPHARFALDKRLQLPAASDAGFAVPETAGHETPAGALSCSSFPCMIKPALVAELRGDVIVRANGRRCADRVELERYVEANPNGGPVLVQPLIQGVGSGIFGLGAAGRVVAPSAHRRVRMMNPEGSGSSACASEPVDQELLVHTNRFIADTRWSGIFMIELLRDTAGLPWFMEFNGRAWGSTALARRQGAEYPAWAVAAALRDPVDVRGFVPREDLVCRHLGRELVHLLYVMRGPRSRARGGWPSRRESARRVLRVRRSDCWYNTGPGQRGYLLRDTVQTLRSAIG